jgi:hypothetical protein
VKNTILVYGAAPAVAAFVQAWLDYQCTVRMLPTEIYILVIAFGFTALGLNTGSAAGATNWDSSHI